MTEAIVTRQQIKAFFDALEAVDGGLRWRAVGETCAANADAVEVFADAFRAVLAMSPELVALRAENARLREALDQAEAARFAAQRALRGVVSCGDAPSVLFGIAELGVSPVHEINTNTLHEALRRARAALAEPQS